MSRRWEFRGRTAPRCDTVHPPRRMPSAASRRAAPPPLAPRRADLLSLPLGAGFEVWAPTYVGAESMKPAPSGGVSRPRGRRPRAAPHDRRHAQLRARTARTAATARRATPRQRHRDRATAPQRRHHTRAAATPGHAPHHSAPVFTTERQHMSEPRRTKPALRESPARHARQRRREPHDRRPAHLRRSDAPQRSHSRRAAPRSDRPSTSSGTTTPAPPRPPGHAPTTQRRSSGLSANTCRSPVHETGAQRELRASRRQRPRA